VTSKYEQLVLDSFARFKRCEKGRVIPVLQGSPLDQGGIDLLTRIFSYAFWIPLQIKPSDTGETVGLILPLCYPPSPETQKRLTKRMREEIESHLEKHPHVNFIIFVGRSNFRKNNAKPKTRETVMDDVWREIKKLFRETAILISKKTLKKRAL